MKNHFRDVAQAIENTGLKGAELKRFLRDLVAAQWPDLPPWTTLEGAVIEETQKASVGSGVVLTFRENGEYKVVLGLAGMHYGRADKSYTIPGGFINLSKTTGSALVAAAATAEDPRTGAAREVEEEFKNADGSPLIPVDPARLKPMDTKTISFSNGEKRVVIGMMMELNPDEIMRVRKHVARMGSDPAYAAAVAAHTVNEASGKPEVTGVEIFRLSDVTDGLVNLLHKDQQSLFSIVEAHYRGMTRIRGRGLSHS